MEQITLFVSIIIIVFGVLQIILFFKIWGMTNDVRDIKRSFYKVVNNDTRISETKLVQKMYNVDDLVIDIETGKQMRIKAITADGKYSCYRNGGTTYVGEFDDDKIKPFNKK